MSEKISIIVPVYNAEKTLDRCVDSLISQTYSNIEIILVDDGSKDSSLQLCYQYAKNDCRIKVISKANGGVSSARNAGLDNATGEFIMFCDSDDWAESEWCDEMRFQFESGCLIMCGQYVEGVQKFFPHEVFVGKDEQRVLRTDFFQLKMKMFNAPWNKIFLREVIEHHHIRFHDKITNGEDLLFNVLYLGCIPGDIICIGKPLYHYEWPSRTSLSNIIPADYVVQRDILLTELEAAISKIGDIGDSNRKRLYTDFFNEYIKVLYSVCNDRSRKIMQRIKIGNKIMKHKEYRICVDGTGWTSNSILRSLYRAKSCYGLFLWYSLSRLIKGDKNE